MDFPIIATISTIVGISGGLLGMYSFFDNYLLKFKPSIQLANVLYLLYDNTKKQYGGKQNLTALVCKLEIFNHRNKLGRLDDLLIRLYNTDEPTPKIYNIFPVSELATLPNDCRVLINSSKKPYTPISVLNKSNREVTLEFSGDRYDSNSINPKSGIRIELHYKSHTKKWTKVGAYTLDSRLSDPDVAGDRDVYSLRILELCIERDKLKNKKAKFELDIYKGMSHYYLRWWLKKPYYFCKKFFSKIISLIFLVIHAVIATTEFIYFELIVNPLLASKGRRIMKVSFSWGDKSKADIRIKKESRGFSIARNRGHIKIYKSGDGHITVQEHGGGGRVLFSVQLNEYVFGLFLWQISGGETLFLSTFCTKILDYFMYHSNYR
jgi:hypothetical protein